MLQSPAKRRKITADTSIPVTDENTNSNATPTTPTRASYLSPTKASLARSHPHLVSNKNGRALTEPRGRLLRNELLRNRDQHTPQTEKPQSTSTEEWKENAAAQRPVARSETATEVKSAPSAVAKPPRPQALAQTRTSKDSASPEPVSPTIIPRLVKKSADPLTRSAPRPRSNEPNLPPTPVQLGLDPQPDRPRGLSSSSPGGSKSGSGRQRVRALNGQKVTSSPLKPKGRPPLVHDMESELDMPREVQDSQMATSDNAQEEIPEELQEKHRTIRNLKLELSKLKAETSDVEDALGANDLPEAPAKNKALMGLFKDTTRTPTNGDWQQEHDITISRSPYRELFSPGNLQLQVTTTTKMMGGHAKIQHRVSLTPPSPWPSNFFATNFEVLTDAEEATVENVIWTDALKGHTQALAIQNELYSWIQSRLKSDLHCLDIGGLIWGIGQYFEASIERAKTFKTLANKYRATMDDCDSDDESDGDNETETDGKISEDGANSLSRFLTKLQLRFDANPDSESTKTTRRSKRSAPKIVAVYKLHPTWHGQIKPIWEIALSGIPDSAQASAAELFERVGKIGGFEKAFGAVWDMITHVVGKNGDGDGKRKEIETGKATAKKRKRFT